MPQGELQDRTNNLTTTAHFSMWDAGIPVGFKALTRLYERQLTQQHFDTF